MLKIYNKTAITKNQRFANALVYGIPTALGLGVLYGIFSNLMSVQFSVVFIGIGYLIGNTVQTKGKGVQNRFSVLGAVLAIVCFMLADLISMFGINPFVSIGNFFFYTDVWIKFMFSMTSDINGILGVAFRVFGVIAAYQNSRIV